MFTNRKAHFAVDTNCGGMQESRIIGKSILLKTRRHYILPASFPFPEDIDLFFLYAPLKGIMSSSLTCRFIDMV